MGGNPCRLKEILDMGNAAQRAAGCMANTAFIAAAYTGGKTPISGEVDKQFVAAAEAYGKACAAVEAELAGFLPPE
jgi:hypothetical protein